jgi:Interleukin-like EMT inducer
MVTAFRNLVTQPWALLQGDAFYPVGLSLTFSEPLFTPALVAGPLHALTGNPVLAYNLTLILFWALSGWAMYAVAIRLTRDHAAALMAAAIFTLCPYRTEMYLEFQMEITFGIPLAVYALVRFLESQRARYLAVFGLVFWLQAISVLYYAVILAGGLAVVVLQYAALRWSGWRARTPLVAAVGGGMLGLALAPVMWPFLVTRRELGFERRLSEVQERSAEVLSYFELRSNWLYRTGVAGYYYETSLFMGAVALSLAAIGVLWLRRERSAPPGWPERSLSVAFIVALALGALTLATAGRGGSPLLRALSFTAIEVAQFGILLAREALDGWRRRQHGLAERRLDQRDWILLLLGLSLIAFLLSLGPVVRFAGRSIGPGLYAWLHPYLLPLRALRAANRIGVLVVFTVALLAAFGVTWLRAHLPRRAFVPAVSTIGLLLALEYATFPLAYGRVPSLARPVDRVLKDAPVDSVVLEWPTNAPMADADAMFRSIGHGKRIVNGYSGFVPQLLAQLSNLLTMPGPPFPVPAAEAYLRRIYPLDFLVVRLADQGLTPARRAMWRELRRAPPPFLRFRGSHGEEDLWEMTPEPERGATAQRWVSFAFLREHPLLRATVRPLTMDPDLEQSAWVLLNGRPVAERRIDEGEILTVTLPPPYRQAAFNVVTLDYRYRRPPSTLDEGYRIGTTGVTSPGDLHVRSAGQPYGDAASIAFNRVELAANQRGYNLIALAADGQVHAAGAFDTYLEPKAAARLAAFVGGLPEGTLVAGAVRDEASHRLTEEAVAALRTLGVAGDLRGHFRESHAFVGVKGAAPGTALEEMGPRALTLTVGRPPSAVGFELQSFALERAANLR